MGSTKEEAELVYRQSNLYGATKEWFLAETHVHKVYVGSLLVDKYEVTNRQFAQFATETGYLTEAENSECGWRWDIRTQKWKRAKGWNWRHPAGDKTNFPTGPEHPVVHISWDDAIEYCKWSGKRLLTEAEWEYVCRAGTNTRFYWGDDPNYENVGKYAWYAGNAENRTHEVGQKEPNRWGLYDMSGNVWEWVADWYNGYPRTSCEGVRFGEFWRVLRGGAWYFHPAYLRCAYRGPTIRGNFVGFRCVIGLQDSVHKS